MLLQAFRYARLHSRKEGFVFKRLHSGTQFQKSAVSGMPAHPCHVKKGRTTTKVDCLMQKLVPEPDDSLTAYYYP